MAHVFIQMRVSDIDNLRRLSTLEKIASITTELIHGELNKLEGSIEETKENCSWWTFSEEAKN